MNFFENNFFNCYYMIIKYGFKNKNLETIEYILNQ